MDKTIKIKVVSYIAEAIVLTENYQKSGKFISIMEVAKMLQNEEHIQIMKELPKYSTN